MMRTPRRYSWLISSSLLNINAAKILCCFGFKGFVGLFVVKPRLIDFYADWCGPCKMQESIIRELEREFGDRVEFKKVDVDANPDMAMDYRVRSIPTLIIERDGEVVKRYIGVTRKQELAGALEAVL